MQRGLSANCPLKPWFHVIIACNYFTACRPSGAKIIAHNNFRVWFHLQLLHAIILGSGRRYLYRARVFCGVRIAECGKLSSGNLRKIKCGTFCKLPLVAFPQSAAEKFRISADGKTTVRSHCTTDVQPIHTIPWSLETLKNEKWFIGYSSSMPDCTSNKTLKQEHTIQNYNTPVTHNVP